MKESKTASFDNIDFVARINSGRLESVAVINALQDGTPATLNREDAVALQEWLSALLGRIAGWTELRPIVPSKPELPSEPASPVHYDHIPGDGVIPLEQRNGLLLPVLSAVDTEELKKAFNGPPKVGLGGDGLSVVNRVPIDKLLKSEGMELLNKEIAPQTVTFSPKRG